MCTKNCCNHTYHAIIVLFILSILLLPNVPNFNLLHRLNDVTRSLVARSGSDSDGEGGVSSPPCTTKMVLAFLYGALFTLILMMVSNNNNSSSHKQNDPQPSTSVNPYRAIVYMSPTEDFGGANEGGGGVGYALLRTFPTFAYSVRRPPKMGNGSKVCVICQYKFRDQELVRWLPDCDHLFHISCIDEWLKSHTTCPCCRFELVNSTSNNQGSISNGIIISPNDAIYYDDFNEYYYNVF